MLTLCNAEYDVFSNVTANVPDVVDEDSREVAILEMGRTFDYSQENAYLTEVLKYQLLRDVIIQLAYKCKLLVFVFGSLSNVHRLVVRGLQMTGLTKTKAKDLAEFCSISVITGSCHI